MEVNYSITDSITPEEYMKLREAVGWGLFPLEEAEAGLSNSYIWCLRDNEASGQPIGIGRVIWDHGYVMYIADIIVIPDWSQKISVLFQVRSHNSYILIIHSSPNHFVD